MVDGTGSAPHAAEIAVDLADDIAKLKLGKPWLAFDLPAGGRRLLQNAEGYVATIKAGQVTFCNGVMHGPLPGVVIRGPQAAHRHAPGMV